jgi:hypothetical protein
MKAADLCCLWVTRRRELEMCETGEQGVLTVGYERASMFAAWNGTFAALAV